MYYQVPRRRRPVLANLMRVVVALLGLAGAAALFVNQYANYALSNPSDNSADVKNAIKALDPAPQNLPDQPVNILVLGSDSRGAHSGARSDTLLLVRMDFNRGFISMLSFPRDLYVQIPGQGPNKINAAYSLGGTKLAIETVKALTGEPIQYFFNVDFHAFTRLVNDAGGVYLDIDRHYFNNNSAGGASFARIDIQPGYQRLNGSDALSYVRYRHTDSDFARIARQQLFLSELKRTSRSVGGVNNIVDAIHSDVTTNLKSPDRLKDFLLFALRTDKDRTARVTIPSTGFATRNGGQSVVLTTDSLIRTAVDRWKNPDFHSQAPVTALPPSKVTVEVFNGTNRIGLANTTGRALQAKGYTVLVGGNAGTFYSSTSIFYAPTHRNEASALQAHFGPNANIVERRAGQPTDADLLVMVGGDYQRLVTPTLTKPTAAKPDTVATLALKPAIQRFRAATKLDALVPLHLPRGSQVIYIRTYNVDHGDQGPPNALTVVLRLAGYSPLGGLRYATITQTDMKSPPLIANAICCDAHGNYTFYDGKNMQRLLWRRGQMTYWVSNSLDETLTVATIRDIQRFMVNPGRAKLGPKKRDARVPVATTSVTP